MRRHEFYQLHLNQVSRSFAFCIARLEGQLKDWIGLAYLLFRLLDTIEDAPWPTQEEQKESFLAFDRMLRNPDLSSAWLQTLSIEVPANEKTLADSAPELMQDFHQLPPGVRFVLERALRNMSAGMQHFAVRKPLRLNSMAELNQYCFFVAGLVGELLSQLRDLAFPSMIEISSQTRMESYHFGMFLQKINILKDQKQDESEGRFLVPNRSLVFHSLQNHAEGAFRYLTLIPVKETGYRLFCAWSLFLGLASLPWIENSWAQSIFNKIPRLATQSLMEQVEKIIGNNEELEKFFKTLLLAAKKTIPKYQNQSEPNSIVDLGWFFKIFDGSMTLAELQELQML